MSVRLPLLLIVILLASGFAKDIVVDWSTRSALMAQASVWFPDREPLIPTRDVWNGPSNPFNISNYDVIDCDFIEPNVPAPEGGTSPKFECMMQYRGKPYALKVKYDQHYNPLLPEWGYPNYEVYASPVVERLLWATGFGADIAVPVTIRCHGCPLEPWTYIRKTCGLEVTDYICGWIDFDLIIDGRWTQKVDVLQLNYSLAYINFDEYQPGDRIFLEGSNGSLPEPGWGWPELYSFPDNTTERNVDRDALTVIAAFFSHSDNDPGNQGLNCIHNDSRSTGSSDSPCQGTPFMFLHDVGCTLGYGWDFWHLDVWPNALDLEQWLELSVWYDRASCIVQVHGAPQASWVHTWQVSEEGRAMAARLLSAVTPQQIEDLFSVARVDMFKGESVAAWVQGFQYKVQRDVLNVTCG